jgi:hypothetical protein
VQAHAAGARLPEIAFNAAQAGEFIPCEAGIGGLEECGILHAGEDGVRVRGGGFQVPDAFEFPRMLGAIIPLVRAGDAVIAEFIANGRPALAAVVGTLDDLAKPAAGLRCV